MVLEIESSSQFEREILGPGLVVVDFFTTWCGPCKQIAPFIDQLSRKYPEVKFIKVDIEKNEDIARPRNIQSIPTFHFYVNGTLKDEMKGANPMVLEQKVTALKVDVNPFGGQGYKLASGGEDGPPAPSNARDARLRAFGALEGPHTRPAPKPAAEEDDEDAALAKALALSIADSGAAGNSKPAASAPSAAQKAADDAEMAAIEEEELAAAAEALKASAIASASNASGDWGDEEMVPVPVNEDLLSQLVDMGFSDVRGRKSLVHGGSLEGALAWLAEHQDDPDIDQPYMVKKSDTIPKPPLTEEEKAAKMLAIKDKVKQRRADREKEAKAEEIRREKERRERGQKIDETLEERQRLQRKRDAERMKKEKADQEKERARLKAEIARDKEIRRLNKGVLPSVLGVDGYNPSIIQYDVKEGEPSAAPAAPTAAADQAVPAKRPAPTASPSPTPAPVAKPAAKKATPAASPTPSTPEDPSARVDTAIATLMRYRTGGDGGAALKLLLTFVKNIVDHPEDPKYRSINTESAAFKTRLASLVGPATLLKAVGFEKNEEDGKLKFDGDASATSLLASTALKLTQAEALYRQQNP